MRKKICVLVFIIFIMVFFNITSYAYDSYDVTDFYYIEVNQVNESKKVYLSDEMALFLRKSNLEILDEPETTGWWVWKKTIHHYYYVASNYVNEIVAIRKIDNSIDSLIYMTKQLENYAIEYKEKNSTVKSLDDLVLGYLRCINKEYSDATNVYDNVTALGFSFLCGSYEERFVNFVNENENNKISTFDGNVTILNFFGYYVQKASFNEKYGTQIDHDNNLIDPIENLQIDVSHMFCVVDALRHGYDNISSPMAYQLISWLGDLHQATFVMNDPKNDFGNIDFYNDILYKTDSKFEISDFIADIDGYNIGYVIINNERNDSLSVSEAISCYYNIIKKDSSLRYKLFIKSVAYEGENPGGDVMTTSAIRAYSNKTIETGINGFKYSACTYMGVSYVDYSDLADNCPLVYNSQNFLYKFMCEDDNVKKGFPCDTLRISMAKEFINYVLRKAGYNEE